MRKKIVMGCAVALSAGLGAFAATGFGDGADEVAVTSAAVETHTVGAPPPGVAGASRRASLFKVIYKSSDPFALDPGTTTVTVGKCPRGGGVLSAWFLRTGPDKSGLDAGGGTPVGLRRFDLVITTTVEREARVGLVCLK
jgi:hypothetical protein